MSEQYNHTLTCVSCYFPVKNKFDDSVYTSWFANTLAIPCPYVFFTTNELVDMIKSFRKDLPTFFIVCDLEDFVMYKFKERMITDPIHCPSIELNIIWNEKIFMVQKASEINPFNSEWFHWIDAGICSFRNTPPSSINYLTQKKLDLLPTDKLIYSQSLPFNKLSLDKDNYHHISGTFIIHKSIINTYTELYLEFSEKLINTTKVWTDQIIHTYIYNDHPTLFFKLLDGYGEISRYLFMESYKHICLVLTCNRPFYNSRRNSNIHIWKLLENHGFMVIFLFADPLIKSPTFGIDVDTGFKTLTVPCYERYDSLTLKIQHAFSALSDFDGILKIDDNTQILNTQCLPFLVKTIKQYDYVGVNINNKGKGEQLSLRDECDIYNKLLPQFRNLSVTFDKSFYYFGGPMYWVSKKVLQLLSLNDRGLEYPWEDLSVGYFISHYNSLTSLLLPWKENGFVDWDDSTESKTN